MTTTSDKLRGLVEALYHQTSISAVDWKLSADKARIWAIIGDLQVEVSEEPGEGFGTDVRVTVYDEEGDEVDTFTDAYFGKAQPVNLTLSSYFSVMSSILEMGKRQASGAERAIDKLLNSLGGNPVQDIPDDDDLPF